MSESTTAKTWAGKGLFFSFSCEGEQRCWILLRNCNDISERYLPFIGHLCRCIVMFNCIQIDWKVYVRWKHVTDSFCLKETSRKQPWLCQFTPPLLLFMLRSPSVPPCRACCKFWLWFIDGLSSSRQLQTQFTCPVKVLLYISEDLQASNEYH